MGVIYLSERGKRGLGRGRSERGRFGQMIRSETLPYAWWWWSWASRVSVDVIVVDGIIVVIVLYVVVLFSVGRLVNVLHCCIGTQSIRQLSVAGQSNPRPEYGRWQWVGRQERLPRDGFVPGTLNLL